MKKIGVFVLLSILVISFVSAQTVFESLARFSGGFYDTLLEPLGKFLLGQSTDSGDIFFGKLMIFIIMFSVSWLVVDKFPLMTGKRKTGFFVALAISLLSVRYLTQAWVDTVILPYSVLGVAMTSLIPFIIYFFFVKDLPNRSMRKIAWIFAFVIFTGMFIYRIDTFNVVDSTTYSVGLSGLSATVGETKSYHTIAGFSPVYIYLFTAILSLIMLWFDGTIQRAFDKARYQDLIDIKKIERRAELAEDYDKAVDRYSKKIISKADANRIINSIRGRASTYGLDPAIFPVMP